MKKVTFILSILLVFGFGAQAQHQVRKMSAEHAAEKMVKKIGKVITLTDNQEDRLENIFENSFRKMQTIRKENLGNGEALRNAMKQNRQETEQAVQRVLSPDQYRRYQEWLQKHPKWQNKCKPAKNTCRGTENMKRTDN